MRLKVGHSGGEIWLSFADDAPVNVDLALKSLKNKAPDIYKKLCNQQGRLQESILAYVNGKHIRYSRGMDTELTDGDEIYLVLLATGG